MKIHFLFLLAGTTLAAQSLPDPLTLPEALRLAAERHPAFLAHHQQERVAEAMVEQAGYRPNPVLSASLENVFGTGRLQGVKGMEATVQATQVLERGGKRARRVALAEQEVHITAQEIAVHHAEELAEVALDYFEVVAAQAKASLARDAARLAQERLQDLQQRVDAGTEAPGELSRAKLAAVTASARVAKQDAGTAAARALLSVHWAGEGDFSVPPFRIQLPDTIADWSVFQAGLEGHPRLAWQRSRITGAEASLALEQAQRAQDITVGGGVRFLSEEDDAAFVAAVSLPLPVRHRNQAAIRAAKERRIGAEAELRVVLLDLSARARAEWQGAKAAMHTVAQLRLEALPLAVDATSLAQRSLDRGEGSRAELISAQIQVHEIHEAILDAEIEALRAITRLEGLAQPKFPILSSALIVP